jgi:hypothetical protein
MSRKTVIWINDGIGSGFEIGFFVNDLPSNPFSSRIELETGSCLTGHLRWTG